jgi:glutaconate CoA-transferase subunit A
MDRTESQGTLFVAPDVDAMRDFHARKPRCLQSKVTTAREAIADLLHDGDYIAVGGFGTNRIPAVLLHEVVRQRRKNLGLAGHTATHDFQILAAGDCLDRCDCAYVVGLEARGLSRAARQLFESGRLKAVEWSNAALAWRFRAAAMGVPFLPARVMLGTDTFRYSGAKEITCPFTGVKLAALPALYPDVALIHVQRCDEYGNAQIDGITVADLDVARAAKRVIISTERLISNEEIRRQPDRTAIPYFCVDAVVVQRYGGYPGNVAYEYFADEDHLREWLKADQEPADLQAHLQKYIYGVPDFDAYLALKGGEARMHRLRAEEFMQSKEEGV